MLRRLLRTRPREVATIVVLATIVVVPVGVAVLHPGFPVVDVDLDARNVWVTNGDELLAGRLSKPIAELDGAVNTTSRDIDVFQHGDDVFLSDAASGTLQRVDPSFTTLTEEIGVPLDAEIAYGGDVLAVMDTGSGSVWTIDAAVPLAFDAATAQPVAKVGPGGHVTVADDGTVFATSPHDRELIRIEPGGDPSVSALPRLGDHQLTAVGRTPVVLDLEHDRLLVDSTEVELPTHALKLQQAGPADDSVLVATGSELLDVALSGGRVERIDPGFSGSFEDPDDVSAPVRLDGCAHAAWAGAARYLLACDGASVRSVDLDRPTRGSTLEFRVNRSVIALNDVSNGNAWLLDDELRLVDDWEQVTPPEDQDAEDGDEKSSTESFEDTIAQRTDENRAPTARDDEFGVRPGLTTVIPVLDNDTDPDGDVLTVSAVAEVSASQGSVQLIDGDRALQFTPADGFTGSLSFRYTANDGRPGGVAEAVASISVHTAEVDDPPIARRTTAVAVEQGGSTTVNVLQDWIDPDGDAVFLVSATPKSGDRVSAAPDGELTFEHVSTELGSKEVVYVVSDGRGTSSGVLTVDVEPTGALGPIGTPDHAQTFSGRTVDLEPLENDTSPSGVPLALIGLEEVPDGVEVVPNLERGSIGFTAAEPGSYEVVYALGAGAETSVGLIRVDVLEPPDGAPAPIAVTDVAYLRPGEPLSIPVLANDVSPSGQVLAVQSVQTDDLDAALTIEVLGNAVVRTTPSSALVEQVQFHYTVSDGTSTSTAGITVVPVPPLVKHQPPVAVDDAARVRAGDIVTVPVLDNDRHPDRAPLIVDPELVVPEGTPGLAFVSGDTVRYQAPAEPGVYSVDYRVTDAYRESAIATVQFVVVGPSEENLPPVAVPTTSRLFADSTVKIPIGLDGLDPDGDSVALRGITTPPKLGRIVSTDAGTIEYQSYPGMAGTDSFEYEVEDTAGASATSVIRVGVIPRPATDAPPNAVDDTVEVPPGRVASVPVWRNDSDPNGYKLTVADELLEVDEGIAASVVDDRIVVEAPDEEGAFAIRYQVENGHGGVDSAFLHVLVTNDARPVHPTSVDQFVSIEDLAKSATVEVDVLDGAENLGGRLSDLELSLVGPNRDAAEVVGASEVRVRATASRTTIGYRLTNGDGLSTTAFIIVPPLPDGAAAQQAPLPYLKDLPPQQTDLDTPIEWTVDELVEVPSGRPALILSASSTNGDGSDVRVDGETLRFTPARGYRGPASVSFLVTDGRSESDQTGAKALLTLPITVGDPDLEDVAPKFTAQAVEVEAGEDPLEIELLDSTSHPNPAMLDRVVFSGLAGANSDIRAGLAGSTLTVLVPRGVDPGVRTTLTFDVTLNGLTVPGEVDVTVVSSSRPLAIPADDPTAAESSTYRRSQTVTLDVLANDVNPFASEGEPLRVVGALLDQVDAGASASISFTDDTVTIRTGPTATGTLSAVYTVQDATGDRTRQVQGRILLSIVDVPDAPQAPAAVEGDGTASVTVASTASNNSPILDYTVTWPGGSLTVPTEGTYTVGGLQNGTAYAFRVSARNAVGESTLSAESATVRPYGVPGAPAAATLTATSNGTGDMTLLWSPPAADGGRGISQYVWREVGAGGSTQTSATAVNLRRSVGTAYSFEVQACNARGCGAWTRSNAATPSAPPTWTPTRYPTTITTTTCPEPNSAYPSGPWNRDSGCTFQPQGALGAGTVIDAVCYSQRNGQPWLYFTSEVGVYDGWFVRADDTSRPGRSIPDC
ncbi:Ig-like domain-containing protein [Agromyces allii]|uniref:Ig-like domain-containing protein n=1 Tax=Agromyces allii TaxID=393607 RepID=A0ABP5BPG8_9MICO|nr:Ig-like domain-containing protein [Agromyces allii]